MEGKSIKESDRYTFPEYFLWVIFFIFLIILGINLVDDDNDLIGHIGVVLLAIGDVCLKILLFRSCFFCCLPFKGNIQILDEKKGDCLKCNTLNSSLEIYRRAINQQRGCITFPFLTHWCEPRVHCMKCGCDVTVREHELGLGTVLLAVQQQQQQRAHQQEQEQENETAVTVDENGMSGSEEEESVESCVLSSSFEHGAKDKSKSLFSDLANAIEKEEREKKEKKPLVSHLEIV